MIFGELLVEKTDNNCFIYINGQKLDTQQDNFLYLLNRNLDKEYSSEILGLLSRLPQRVNLQPLRLETKIDFFINAINEINKTVYGVKVGRAKRNEAFTILKNILKKPANFDPRAQNVYFAELGITLYFCNDTDIVEEILITSPFEGSTTFGLKVGHSMEKAVELCGEPRIRSLVTAFWNSFSVSLRNEIVTAIKIN